MHEGYACCEMVVENGEFRDFVFRDVNAAFERLTGLADVVGKKVTEVIPGIRETDPGLFEICGRVATTGKAEKFETYVAGLKTWFSVCAYCPATGSFVAVFDITDRLRGPRSRALYPRPPPPPRDEPR